MARKPVRTYKLNVDGTNITLRADTFTEPTDSAPFYTLELAGETIAKFQSAYVRWWMVEPPAA